jgi:hypothetical protein
MIKNDFKTFVCDTMPESLFFRQYGQETYEYVTNNSLNNGYCKSCGHEPRYSDPNKVLHKHIYYIDFQNPHLSKCITLCAACHSTQHIKSSIKKGYVKFVNSSLSQKDLVIFSRHGDLGKLYNNGQIIDLKKTPEQFLYEINSGVFKISNTLKVVFTNNFEFNDL